MDRRGFFGGLIGGVAGFFTAKTIVPTVEPSPCFYAHYEIRRKAVKMGCKLANVVKYDLCEWTAERVGKPPEIPATPKGCLGTYVNPMSVVLDKQGQAIYKVSGSFLCKIVK